MSKFVRFTKNYDHWATPSILTPFKKGEERRITEAQYEAANADGAVELINGEDAEQGTAAPEAGSAPAKSASRNKARD